MSKAKENILRLAEIVLLIPAFGFLIPPVPSVTGHVYRLFPGVFIAGVCFVLSQCAVLRRDKTEWWASGIKIVLFLAFAWLLLERVKMGR